jgi:hypothetical protein
LQARNFSSVTSWTPGFTFGNVQRGIMQS